MSKKKIREYTGLNRLVTDLRDDLTPTQTTGDEQPQAKANFVLLYAYNGTGKTRLSMAFKDNEKRKHQDNLSNTLYFNAFTEDLFYWDNDLENDEHRKLHLRTESKFFNFLTKNLPIETKIQNYYQRYVSVDFDINYEEGTVSFRSNDQDNIKISRGEETLFIWCLFLAICELAIEENEEYNWVKYIYIDDPISSLDDNNVITVACDLAKLLRSIEQVDEFDKNLKIKTLISSHHSLFFNVMCNELKKNKPKRYFLHKNANDVYGLQATDDTPFFHHVAMLSELKKNVDSEQLNTYHFNVLRNILEKTATFFGYDDFSKCLTGIDDQQLYARALNLLSHGNYSAFSPVEMTPDNKDLFTTIFNGFLTKYSFELPDLMKGSNH